MNKGSHIVKRYILYLFAAVTAFTLGGIVSPLSVLATPDLSQKVINTYSERLAAPTVPTMEDKMATRRQINESDRSRVAIIVDDFGNGMRGTDEILSLPIKITVAVMPFLSTSDSDARRAHERGFDVLLHLPMEPRHGKPEWLGPGAVLAKMGDEEIRQRVETALDNIPYAIGINNHMGSKVTGDERVMGIVLNVCKERGLFFVDSKTNYRSVVGKIALEKGLPRVENHIFLDDRHTSSHVLKQMRLVREHALEQHYCITIGHVGLQGKETAAGIRSGIAEIRNSVEFVGISDLVKEEWKWSPDPKFP